jgi:hypothetical protein
MILVKIAAARPPLLINGITSALFSACAKSSREKKRERATAAGCFSACRGSRRNPGLRIAGLDPAIRALANEMDRPVRRSG